MSPELPSPDAWTGRHDGDGPAHSRWHEQVRLAAPSRPGAHVELVEDEHVALLGFRSDEGVRRNRGRTGAADGPAALRRALAPLALHDRLGRGEVGIVDRGDVVTDGEDLEGGQATMATAISTALDEDATRMLVVLGGGHETAWASYQGLVGSERLGIDGPRGTRWGVLNLDAHFDLRREDRPTSGTPFLQMAEAEAAAGRELAYAVLGISEPSNTQALFDEAQKWGVQWLSDVDCCDVGAQGVAEFVAAFAADLDALYLTIDLDVMPAATAPGVSAPAAFGVPLPLISAAVRAAAGTGKLALLDVVELNPAFDIDSRTARSAARLIDDAVRTATAC